MKRASLTLLLVAAALCAWFLWPRSAARTPELGTPSPAKDTHAESGAKIESGAAPEQAAPAPRVELPSATVDSQAQVPDPAPTPRATTELDPPPGTIEVLVVRGRERARRPVVGAQVTLHASESEGDARPARDQAQLAIAFADKDGRCRFTDVGPGHYVLRAIEGESEREGKAEVQSGEPTPRVVLVFGTSRIHGTVYDLDGKPLPNCTLRLDYTTAYNRTSTPSTLRAIASTDAKGKYAFGELAYDTYSLVLSGPGRESTDGWPGRTWIVRPGEDRDLELDAGAPRGADHWTGVLRRRNGTAVQETRPISLSCDNPPNAEGVLEISIESSCSSTGDFDFPLEPGTWLPVVSATPFPSESYSVERRDVPVGGLHQDIIAP